MHGNLATERVESFGGGMDGFNRSSLLALDVAQYFQNIFVPDNLEARTRAGANKLGAAGPADPLSEIQGLLYFDTPIYEQLIAGSGGKLWHWSTPFAAWTEMAGWALPDSTLLLAAAQGVDKVLFSAGSNENMRSWNGAAFTDLGNNNAGINGDPPVGATILCWHSGRMFASGKPNEDDALFASKLLQFGAGDWDYTQFKLRIGGGEGDPIRALASLQDDYLTVLKENSVYLVVTTPGVATAANWTIRKLSSGIGIVGKRAGATVGNDFMFMSRSGVYSVRRMAAAAGQYELSPPISEPMQPWIERINWDYAHLIAAHSYKHLVFFAVPLDAATTPDTLLVFNARLGRWIGIWSGWTPRAFETSRFAGVERLIIGHQTGTVAQWKDYLDAAEDDTYTDDTVAIPTKAWLRSFLFGAVTNDKDSFDAELRFSSSNAIVNVALLGDNAELRSWQHDVRQTGVSLPVNLPFDLVSPRARTAGRGLRDLRRFNECYLKIESDSGWWSLRNVTMRARIKKVPTR